MNREGSSTLTIRKSNWVTDGRRAALSAGEVSVRGMYGYV